MMFGSADPHRRDPLPQASWKTWVHQFVLIAINKGPYRRHLFASSFSASTANTASENLAIVEV